MESQKVSPFLVWFISLNINEHKVRPHCSIVRITVFEGPNHIPLCVYHSLFMELAVHGHLDCFCLLASVNHAVVNMTAAISIFSPLFPNLLGTQHELELNYIFTPCVSFGVISVMSCTVAEPFQFIFLYGRILLKLLNIPCVTYSFTHQWTLEWVLPLGYCE